MFNSRFFFGVCVFDLSKKILLHPNFWSLVKSLFLLVKKSPSPKQFLIKSDLTISNSNVFADQIHFVCMFQQLKPLTLQ